MRALLVSIPVILAIGVLGTSSFAQQTSPIADTAKKQQLSAMTQDKLKQSLEKAGFTNVRVVDATYMVHAQTSDGNNVVMYINPPSVGSAATGGSSGASGTGTSGSGATTDSSPAKKQ